MFGKSQNKNLDRIIRGLDHQEISTIPSVLSRILTVSRDPKSHAADLASVCEMDKATSARLLRAANSVYYATGNQDRVDNIKDAIVRIGFHTAEEIIMSATVSSLLKTAKGIADYTPTALWRHSIAVAVGCRLIYHHKYGATSKDLFVVGLLHDFGIAIEHQFLSEDGFQDAIVRRFQNESLLAEEERAVMGVTHQEIGELVARKWNFPDHMIAVIGHHHDHDHHDEKYEALLHVIRLAEYMSFKQQQGYADFSGAYAQQLEASRAALGIEPNVIELMSDFMAKEMNNLTNLGWFSELRLKLK